MKARSTYIFAAILFAVVTLIPVLSLETAVGHPSAFQYTGDGRIEFIDLHTLERLSIIYRDKDGVYNDSALSAIDHTLRCHGKSERYPISLKLVELIDYLQDHFGADYVNVISGYRSPEYNEYLRSSLRRVAHNSLHMRGLAMDIRLPSVNKVALGNFAKGLKTGGVGVYYDSDFVHIDVGPVRNW
jgi:uncharacterized protein YcbK (DUF882 family)